MRAVERRQPVARGRLAGGSPAPPRSTALNPRYARCSASPDAGRATLSRAGTRPAPRARRPGSWAPTRTTACRSASASRRGSRRTSPCSALARNHVLLDQPLGGDAAQDAPRDRGRPGPRPCVRRRSTRWRRRDGFSFVAQSATRRARWASTVRAGTGCECARAAACRRHRVVILRDGQPVAEDVEASKRPRRRGVYRAEACVPGWKVPWVVTNPIYVFDEAAAAGASAAARALAEPPAPRRRQRRRSTRSKAMTRVRARLRHRDRRRSRGRDSTRRRGIDGRGCARASRSASACPTPAARGRRSPRWWIGRRGTSAGRQRPSPRDQRGRRVPASGCRCATRTRRRGTKRTEWWFASVRTSPEWRRDGGAVRAACGRSTREPDGRARSRQGARASSSWWTRAPSSPARSGTVWIDDLGVY